MPQTTNKCWGGLLRPLRDVHFNSAHEDVMDILTQHNNTDTSNSFRCFYIVTIIHIIIRQNLIHTTKAKLLFFINLGTFSCSFCHTLLSQSIPFEGVHRLKIYIGSAIYRFHILFAILSTYTIAIKHVTFTSEYFTT